jgi:hypothetical protein
VKREAGESASSEFKAVLNRNSGFSIFTSVCQVLNGHDVDSHEDITAEKIPLLKYAPVTSCDVERFFSAYKRILSDRRKSVTHKKYGKDFNCVSCIKILIIVTKNCK